MGMARRCAKYRGRKCIRFKKVRVKTAKGIRQGKEYYKGDRIRKGEWKKGRWSRATKQDRKRYGGKYESWERKYRKSKR